MENIEENKLLSPETQVTEAQISDELNIEELESVAGGWGVGVAIRVAGLMPKKYWQQQMNAKNGEQLLA